MANPQDPNPRSCLILSDYPDISLALIQRLARPLERISFWAGSEEEALQLAGKAVHQGAIALPFREASCEGNPLVSPEAAERIVRRTIEDFGRLDLVLVIVDMVRDPAFLEKLAGASAKALRESRPLGRILVAPCTASEEPELFDEWSQTVDKIRASWKNRYRAAIDLVSLNPETAPENTVQTIFSALE